MNHIMLDFETLGTQPNAVVVSLGAVIFGLDGIKKEGYWVFDINHQIKRGRSVTGDTIAWWISQSANAKVTFSEINQKGIMLDEFIPALGHFCSGFSQLRAWGNGANFDISIIEHIYASMGHKLPWLYYNTRCYRTMKSCFGIEAGGQFKGVKHNALDDAKNQANYLIEYWKKNPEACK